MTLVTTEIWPQPPAYIVMAADRRISRAGKPDSNRQKLFALPAGRLAGISYFGIAEVQLATRRMWMDDWLRDFLNHHTTAPTLSALSDALASSLNAVSGLDRTQPSGFQLAGIAADGSPQYWYIRNVDDDGRPVLGEWQAREDFQRRDALQIGPEEGVIYRNGDYRAHVAAWEALDVSFGRMLALPDFSPSQGPQARLQMVRFKMDVIAAFYDQFASKPIVGRPVDALLIDRTGVTHWRRWPGLPVLPFRK